MSVTLTGIAKGSKYPDACLSALVPRVYCRLAAATGRGAPLRYPPRPKVPPPTGADIECLDRIDGRMQAALRGERGAWVALVDACRACGRPFRGDDDALGWRRCEIALEVERRDAELRTRSRSTAPNDDILGAELRRRLEIAAEEEQRSLDCVGLPGCPS